MFFIFIYEGNELPCGATSNERKVLWRLVSMERAWHGAHGRCIDSNRNALQRQFKSHRWSSTWDTSSAEQKGQTTYLNGILWILWIHCIRFRKIVFLHCAPHVSSPHATTSSHFQVNGISTSRFFFSCSSFVYNKSPVIRQTTIFYDNYSRCKSILWYFNALIRYLLDSFLNCRRRRRRGRSHRVVCSSIVWVNLYFAWDVGTQTYIDIICIAGASVRSFWSSSVSFFGFNQTVFGKLRFRVCRIVFGTVVAAVVVFATRIHNSIFITFFIARSGGSALKLALFKFTYSP